MSEKTSEEIAQDLARGKPWHVDRDGVIWINCERNKLEDEALELGERYREALK